VAVDMADFGLKDSGISDLMNVRANIAATPVG
jgi:hypothetical protein